MGNMCRRVRAGGLLPTLRTAHIRVVDFCKVSLARISICLFVRKQLGSAGSRVYNCLLDVPIEMA